MRSYFLMALVSATYLVLLSCLMVDIRQAHGVKAAALAKKIAQVWHERHGMKENGEEPRSPLEILGEMLRE